MAARYHRGLTLSDVDAESLNGYANSLCRSLFEAEAFLSLRVIEGQQLASVKLFGE